MRGPFSPLENPSPPSGKAVQTQGAPENSPRCRQPALACLVDLVNALVRLRSDSVEASRVLSQLPRHLAGSAAGAGGRYGEVFYRPSGASFCGEGAAECTAAASASRDSATDTFGGIPTAATPKEASREEALAAEAPTGRPFMEALPLQLTPSQVLSLLGAVARLQLLQRQPTHGASGSPAAAAPSWGMLLYQ
ncbi:hypothetical protein cyc_06432 [Cyclospora cayetanensis]|uniref:Uncharacterized protein n=1 Tax=Cyclospora cayetanensis TaxID=88456 RepID=A0A1D3CUF5_9EIME|nr:hypothetical protein cyc_06432 [Cyclospora cayetanensis]